jgi:hypothetical protein
MSKRKPVDLEAIRQARANLRQIAREHPELVGEPSAGNREGWERTLETMENDEQIVVRLPSAIVERIDAYAERMKKEQPGFRITRSDVVRSLIVRALDEAEATRKR